MSIPIKIDKEGKGKFTIYACKFSYLADSFLKDTPSEHVHQTLEEAHTCLILYVRAQEKGMSDEQFLKSWKTGEKDGN